jgi:hypothetical protein
VAETIGVQRGVKIFNNDGTPVSTSNRFPVDMSAGSITASIHPSETAIEHQTASTIPASTISTVLTYTNSGDLFFITHINGTGTAAGRWLVYINDVLKITKRTTAAEMNLDLPMHFFRLGNTDKIDVKVEHYSSNTRDFDCAMHYER